MPQPLQEDSRNGSQVVADSQIDWASNQDEVRGIVCTLSDRHVYSLSVPMYYEADEERTKIEHMLNAFRLFE